MSNKLVRGEFPRILAHCGYTFSCITIYGFLNGWLLLTSPQKHPEFCFEDDDFITKSIYLTSKIYCCVFRITSLSHKQKECNLPYPYQSGFAETLNLLKFNLLFHRKGKRWDFDILKWFKKALYCQHITSACDQTG